MIYNEVHKDLFSVDKSYYLAQCIASDFRMGAGIAVQFQKKFSLRDELIKTGKENTFPGSCVLIKRVLNLITKRRSSGKPTYETLKSSLLNMKHLCIAFSITKIAMPKIGCGLDRLQWGKVKEMLHETFNDMPIEILVCVWR